MGTVMSLHYTCRKRRRNDDDDDEIQNAVLSPIDKMTSQIKYDIGFQ